MDIFKMFGVDRSQVESLVNESLDRFDDLDNRTVDILDKLESLEAAVKELKELVERNKSQFLLEVDKPTGGE